MSELDIAGGKSGRLMPPQEAINMPVTQTCWSGDVTAETLVGGITNHDILVRDQNKNCCAAWSRYPQAYGDAVE